MHPLDANRNQAGNESSTASFFGPNGNIPRGGKLGITVEIGIKF
jgi:hypothetical protein